MHVRIYKPSRSTMQTGLAATLYWVLEYPPEEPREPDPLMGWTSEHDTRRQIRLRFGTLQQALEYAQRHGLDADIQHPQTAQFLPKSYGSNFAYDRAIPWSH